MRNLKKFLALVLAMMMVFGLMVTANAATAYESFPDTDAVSDEYVNTMKVITELKVLQGDDGELNPKGTLERDDFAVVLYRLATGDLSANDENMSRVLTIQKAMPSEFPDIAEDDWVKPWTNYAYNQGWLKGDENGNFNPKSPVTVPEMLVSILRVLGLDKGIGGSNWETQTINLAAQAQIVDNMSVFSGEASREMVAQMALNGLTYAPAEATKYELTVTTKGKTECPNLVILDGEVYNSQTEAVAAAVSVEAGAKVGSSNHFTLTKFVDTTMTIAGEHGLTWSATTDANGKPVIEYKKNGTTLITVDDTDASAGGYTTDICKDNTKTIAKIVNDTTVTDYVITLNGKTDLLTKDSKLSLGDKYEIYNDGEGKVTVAVTRYYAGVVENITTTTGSNATITITTNGSNSNITGIATSKVSGSSGLAKGDVICWYTDKDGKYYIETLEPEFDAKLVSVKDNKYTLSDGVAHELLGTVSTVTCLTVSTEFVNEYHFYTVNGFIVAAVQVGLEGQTPTAKDYVIIDGIDVFKGASLNDPYTVQARIVHMNTGVAEVVQVASVKKGGNTYTVGGSTYNLLASSGNATTYNTSAIAGEKKAIYEYTPGANGCALVDTNASELKASSGTSVAITKNNTAITQSTGGNVLVDNNTVFLVANKVGASDHTYTSYTGKNNVPTLEVNTEASAGNIAVAWYLKEADSTVASYVFVPTFKDGTKSTGDEGDNIFILDVERDDESAETTVDGTYYEYSAIVDGEATTIKVLDKTPDAVTGKITAIGVYTPTYDANGVVIDLELASHGDEYENGYERSSGGLLIIESTSGNLIYTCAADVPVFIVDGSGKVSSDIAANITSDDNDKIFVIDSSSDVLYLVIYVVANPEDVKDGQLNASDFGSERALEDYLDAEGGFDKEPGNDPAHEAATNPKWIAIQHTNDKAYKAVKLTIRQVDDKGDPKADATAGNIKTTTFVNTSRKVSAGVHIWILNLEWDYGYGTNSAAEGLASGWDGTADKMGNNNVVSKFAAGNYKWEITVMETGTSTWSTTPIASGTFKVSSTQVASAWVPTPATGT